MKIVHHVNPFRTQVILTDQEKADLTFKIEIDKLHRLLDAASGYLSNDRFYDPEKALEQVNVQYRLSSKAEKSAFEIDVQNTLQQYLDALSGEHNGSCVQQPGDCTKCAAEQLLGINTLYTLSTSTGNILFNAFKALESTPGFNPSTHNAGLVSAVLTQLQKDRSGLDDDYNRALIDLASEWITSYERVHRGAL